MAYSDIPTWLVRRAPIDWALELHAGMSLPLRWGPFEIPPLSAGTLSLFELAVIQFLQDPGGASVWDVMRGVYIAVKREEAHALCQQDRAWTTQFDVKDISTWSPLDSAALQLFASTDADKQPELFNEESRLQLWKWFDVAFTGYRMMHGGMPSAPSEWLYGIDSLAAYVRLMGTITNESVFNIIWRLPVALGSHLSAQNAAATNPEVKIYREPAHDQIDRLRTYIKETEDKGKLLYWQRMWPERYDLSDVQVDVGGDELVRSFAALREEVGKMPRQTQEDRASEILAKEGVN